MIEEIAAFVTARLDDDEADARDALARQTTSQRMINRQMVDVPIQPRLEWRRSTWTPGRVLREIEAKRRILAQARAYSPELEHGDNGEWVFDLVLRQMAAVWADHPGYDPAWAPS